MVVLMTPDEIAYLRDDFASESDSEHQPATQPRPNVFSKPGWLSDALLIRLFSWNSEPCGLSAMWLAVM